MGRHGVEFPADRLAAVCRRYHIQRLSLFGSILRDDFTTDSDIDMLVEFKPNARTGLLFFRLQRELTEMLGRQVDLNTPDELSRHFRDEALRQAEVIYDAA